MLMVGIRPVASFQHIKITTINRLAIKMNAFSNSLSVLKLFELYILEWESLFYRVRHCILLSRAYSTKPIGI